MNLSGGHGDARNENNQVDFHASANSGTRPWLRDTSELASGNTERFTTERLWSGRVGWKPCHSPRARTPAQTGGGHRPPRTREPLQGEPQDCSDDSAADKCARLMHHPLPRRFRRCRSARSCAPQFYGNSDASPLDTTTRSGLCLQDQPSARRRVATPQMPRPARPLSSQHELVTFRLPTAPTRPTPQTPHRAKQPQAPCENCSIAKNA